MKKKYLLLLVLLGFLLQNTVAVPPAPADDKLKICSFNIQFLGFFKDRDNQCLADILSPFDIVVVQELVTPPMDGQYPNGEIYTAIPESKAFVEEMQKQGFHFILSEEDTGKKTNHKNNTSSEWYITFYKKNKVKPAKDIPNGFLDEKRYLNPDYNRVPYAFSFRTEDNHLDFVLISVHLPPNKNQKELRETELQNISEWINDHDSKEKDFIILGDMNIESQKELLEIIPSSYKSLNEDCVRTNTLINKSKTQGAKPYDHVMYRPDFSPEIDSKFEVLDLIAATKSRWKSEENFPGDPYVHNKFRTRYSDHHPVIFHLTIPDEDDD